MLKLENTEVLGWEHAIRGMRNPMNSWEKSDSRNNIITLCGSSKFKDEFLKVQKELSLKGYLVLSLGLFGHSGDDEAWAKKDLLDQVHKQKIDKSFAIFVIDVDGYVGKSTKSEIEYAINQSKTVYFYSHDDLEAVQEIKTAVTGIGPNDLDLMKRLRNAGTDHRKFMRMITVYVDITGPLYWWKEFKTYRAGRKFGDDEPDVLPIPEDYLEFDIEMNSCSTMHKITAKEFTLEDFSHEHLDTRLASSLSVLEAVIAELNHWRNNYLVSKSKEDWWQMIQLLPSSYNQRRTVMLNYEVLANIYKSRRNHKLDEWHTFCDWIEELPYSELITGPSLKDIPISNEIMEEAKRRVHEELNTQWNKFYEMHSGYENAERAVFRIRREDVDAETWDALTKVTQEGKSFHIFEEDMSSENCSDGACDIKW